MTTKRLRVGHPPLGPCYAHPLEPGADSTPASFSKIEGWEPAQFRGVKLGRMGDGVSGARLLKAARVILTPNMSWTDVRDVCERLLVASATVSTARCARVSASEGCKALACFPYDVQTIYECDTWIWGPTPIPAARIRYDALRREIEKTNSGKPCAHFHEWWTRKRQRPRPTATQLELF